MCPLRVAGRFPFRLAGRLTFFNSFIESTGHRRSGANCPPQIYVVHATISDNLKIIENDRDDDDTHRISNANKEVALVGQ
jgi:hypothetical protein